MRHSLFLQQRSQVQLLEHTGSTQASILSESEKWIGHIKQRVTAVKDCKVNRRSDKNTGHASSTLWNTFTCSRVRAKKRKRVKWVLLLTGFTYMIGKMFPLYESYHCKVCSFLPASHWSPYNWCCSHRLTLRWNFDYSQCLRRYRSSIDSLTLVDGRQQNRRTMYIWKHFFQANWW